MKVVLARYHGKWCYRITFTGKKPSWRNIPKPPESMDEVRWGLRLTWPSKVWHWFTDDYWRTYFLIMWLFACFMGWK